MTSLVEKFRDTIRGKRKTLADAIGKNDIAKVAEILAMNKDASGWILADRDDYAEKAIHLALRVGATDVLPLLLQPGRTPVDERGNRGVTPLMIAASMGNIVAAKLLLSRGADINAVDNSGYGTLYHACLAHSGGAVEFLLARGADINGPAGSTPPLMFAVGSPHSRPLLDWLLAKGADPNRQDSEGRCALDAALSMPNLDAVQVLLDHGARVDNRNGRTGATLIWSAATLKNDALVDRLLAAGADPEAPMDDKGTNVLTLIADRATPATCEKISLHIYAAKNARNAEAVEKEMAAGAPAAISVKPIKLKLS